MRKHNVRRFAVVFAVVGFAAVAAVPAWQSAANYTEVSVWPKLATTAAGTPSAWNFGQVVAVATGADGNILVLHRGAQPILVFEPDGTFVRGWGEGLFSNGKVMGVAPEDRAPGASGYTAVYGPAGCQACGAHAIRVDPEGHVWVVDAPGHAVYKLRETGEVLMHLGTPGVPGAGHDTFNLPTDIAFAPNGDIYVSDGYGNARIVRFSKEGRYLGDWGSRGAGPGQFGLPHGVAVAGDGRVYTVDRDNRRVQVFDAEGKFLDQWTDLTGVQALFVTREQRIWAGGALRTLDGEILAELTGGGGGHGMTVSHDGGVFAAQLSGRVQKFAVRSPD
ncbi:MAG: hypothetical protein F4X11_24975 [Acidobacteria bacterium]|nr:hypothetical protein [Acidobacteriota bacterium]